MTRFPSWPGFVPAIHVFLPECCQDVMPRAQWHVLGPAKPDPSAGHDELCHKASFHRNGTLRFNEVASARSSEAKLLTDPDPARRLGARLRVDADGRLLGDDPPA